MQKIPSIHIESSPQTNSPETKRMLRRWSNYHTEYLRKNPKYNPSKRVSYAKIVGKNLSNGTVAGNKQSKKKNKTNPLLLRKKRHSENENKCVD